jgi:hypothetical protein
MKALARRRNVHGWATALWIRHMNKNRRAVTRGKAALLTRLAQGTRSVTDDFSHTSSRHSVSICPAHKFTRKGRTLAVIPLAHCSITGQSPFDPRLASFIALKAAFGTSLASFSIIPIFATPRKRDSITCALPLYSWKDSISVAACGSISCDRITVRFQHH